MQIINFSSTNLDKINIAKSVCQSHNIIVKAVGLDIDEIQAEDADLIVKDKAKRAYKKLGAPVTVSDDSWQIWALGGFPGPYMKSINQWFTVEDFLRLMHGIQDRRVTLQQRLAYTDGQMVKIFKKDLHGQILEQPRGEHKKSPNMTITVMDLDNGKTFAEVLQQNTLEISKHYNKQNNIWYDFIAWYKNQ